MGARSEAGKRNAKEVTTEERNGHGIRGEENKYEPDSGEKLKTAFINGTLV